MDFVFAKKGTKKLVGRGVVTGEYEFDPEGDPEIIADDWCYRFTAYPSAGRFFYRNNADVEGQVTIAYSGGGTLIRCTYNAAEAAFCDHATKEWIMERLEEEFSRR